MLRTALAIVNLALCWKVGIGVEQSLVEAYAWGSAADTNGDPSGGGMRAELQSGMDPAQRERAQERMRELCEELESSQAGAR